MEQTPSIGRIVHYVHPVECDNAGKIKVNPDGSEVARVISPAVVQEVDKDDTTKVLLFAMRNAGGTIGRVPATLANDTPADPNEGYWQWPSRA